MEYSLRAGTVLDADILSSFWVRLMEEEAPLLMEAGPNGLSDCKRSLLNMLPVTDRVRCLILQSDRIPVGFVLGYTYERPYGHPKYAGQILHWYVLPEHRGKGQGRSLLDGMMDWMADQKVGIIEVMAKDDPERNAAWSSRGFVVTLKMHGKKLS